MLNKKIKDEIAETCYGWCLGDLQSLIRHHNVTLYDLGETDCEEWCTACAKRGQLENMRFLVEYFQISAKGIRASQNSILSNAIIENQNAFAEFLIERFQLTPNDVQQAFVWNVREDDPEYNKFLFLASRNVHDSVCQ